VCDCVVRYTDGLVFCFRSSSQVSNRGLVVQAIKDFFSLLGLLICAAMIDISKKLGFVR
jgi:hypothetical protein